MMRLGHATASAPDILRALPVADTDAMDADDLSDLSDATQLRDDC